MRAPDDLAGITLRAPSIPGVVRWAGQEYGGAEAVVDGGRRLSFVEMAEQMTVAARGFMARGVEPGDRVALWAPNSVDWIVAALGVLGCGAVLVPINTRFKGAEAGYVLAKSGARILVAAEEVAGSRLIDLVRVERDATRSLESIVQLTDHDADPADEADPAGGTDSWRQLLAGGQTVAVSEVERRIDQLEPGHLSDLIFTSGTTGRPKGVMLTHGQTVAVYQAWSETVGLRRGDRYLIVYPFFHTAGYKSGWFSCVLSGATAIPEPVFEPGRVLRRVQDERVTVLPGPPTMLQDILDAPERRELDLSSLRLTVTGAATVPIELIRRLRAEMTFTTIITGYGLTETCGTAAMCRHDDDLETIAHWSGRAIPGTELAVVDDHGSPVAAGDPGEVVTRGYHVMRGYFDDPEETRATIDQAGWLHTGDIGVMDDRGYVRITDRKKDMFIVGGFNAYPAEIEGLLLRHPAIAQVSVVGVPDERLGEVGYAYVVRRPGHDLEATELSAWARENMANFKVPRHVEMVERLPVNATGKVVRFELRERARAAVATTSAT